MSKQKEKTLHVQTEILRKKLIIHLNRFDYSQLHFCVQNLFIRNSPSLFRANIKTTSTTTNNTSNNNKNTFFKEEAYLTTIINVSKDHDYKTK